MANVKISQLPSLSTMTNEAIVPVVADGVTQQITGANLAAFFGSGTGNIGFVGDAIYDYNGMIIENADLTHGATAAVILPSNGNSISPVQITNTYGNITLNAGPDPGNLQVWQFGANGALSLPYGTIKTTSDSAIAIGVNAGTGGSSAVSLGSSAGANAQSFDAIAIGGQAGANTQGGGAIAIGGSAGADTQGAGAIAIGPNAGQFGQGTLAIAIGASAGYNVQASSSIVINATGSELNNIVANTFVVAPVRNDTGNTTNVLYYNTSTKEITYGPAGGYGNANVATFLAAYGSNTVVTTGNITGGNIIATANVLGNGYARFTGTFDESQAATAGIYVGYAGGTPRMMFGTGNTLQTFEIDNDAGNLRFYQPGSTKATLTPTGIWSVAGNIITTANISGGNILGGANVNATTHTGTTVSVTGNITGGNVSATNIAGSLTTAAQGNITSVGTLNGVVVSGSALADTFRGRTGSDLPIQGVGNANILIQPAGTGITDFYNRPIANISTASVIGNITGGNLAITGNSATITSANYSVGYLNIPQISFAANATAALVDSGKHYYTTSASNLALTLADNSAVSWPVGTALSIVNRGTANVTVAPAAGVSLYLAGNSSSGNRTVTTYGMATVMNVAANVWMISGTVV